MIPDVQAALKQIESKANNLARRQPPPCPNRRRSVNWRWIRRAFRKAAGKAAPAEVDGGREAMYKIFVDSKTISAGDFDLC